MDRMSNALARFMETCRRQREELQQWTAANPELARDWDAALVEEEDRKRARQERGAIEWALSEARVPSRAREAWEDGLRETEAVKALHRWLESGRTFLLLTGGPGTGKTVASVEAVARLKRARFARAVETCRLGLYTHGDVERMAELRRCRLLVLDDLGAEFLSDVWLSQFDELVDYRYGERLRTVFTSNLTPESFRDRYGARVADRIRHDGQVVRCGDLSLRRQEVRP
jgi:DNA replication protein DnaC